jgi:hypothetical protein
VIARLSLAAVARFLSLTRFLSSTRLEAFLSSARLEFFSASARTRLARVWAEAEGILNTMKNSARVMVAAILFF